MSQLMQVWFGVMTAVLNLDEIEFQQVQSLTQNCTFEPYGLRHLANQVSELKLERDLARKLFLATRKSPPGGFYELDRKLNQLRIRLEGIGDCLALSEV